MPNRKLQVVQEVKGKLRLIFIYDKQLVELLKTLPYAHYSKPNKWWDLEPLSRLLFGLRMPDLRTWHQLAFGT